VNTAKITIRTATITNVGRMALRRRPTRRLLNPFLLNTFVVV
jgi:hypothetical protein